MCFATFRPLYRLSSSDWLRNSINNTFGWCWLVRFDPFVDWCWLEDFNPCLERLKLKGSSNCCDFITRIVRFWLKASLTYSWDQSELITCLCVFSRIEAKPNVITTWFITYFKCFPEIGLVTSTVVLFLRHVHSWFSTNHSFYLCCFYLITDLDECASAETNECDPDALCNNTQGSYICRCMKGFEGDGRNCTGNRFSPLCLMLSRLFIDYPQPLYVPSYWNIAPTSSTFLFLLTSHFSNSELCDIWPVLVNVICLPTEHQRALGARFKGDRAFQVELEFRNVGFFRGRKTGEPREKPSEQGQEPTTNSTHIWRRVRESNPGHIGGRRAPLTTAPYLLSRTLQSGIVYYVHFSLSTDIDECASSETNECDSNSLCTNTRGSYLCRCLKGYQGDGLRCAGILYAHSVSIGNFPVAQNWPARPVSLKIRRRIWKLAVCKMLKWTHGISTEG